MFTSLNPRASLVPPAIFLGLISLFGCTSTALRSGATPDVDSLADGTETTSTQLVEDLATPSGMNWLAAESVALVVGLPGTGSDPGPSAQREALLNEMRTRRVEDPNRILESPATSQVLVRTFIPPAARKGDRVDVEVRVPKRSKTTSLRGGWLMQSRLTEMAVLNSRVATGHVMALAQGHILDDAQLHGEDDKVRFTRGRVLGGGVVAKDRPLGLVMRERFHSVKASARIGRAINGRFSIYDRGNKTGVANPKRDNFIELKLHPRYHDNLTRYIRVIQSIPVRESPTDRTARLQRLRGELLEPASAERAAIRLEALGDEGKSTLLAGISSTNEEVRFYAAEALAYLGDDQGTNILKMTAGDLPPFRAKALRALGTVNSAATIEAMTDLLHVPSAETRYGAFYILSEVSPNDPVIAGKRLGDGVLKLHQIVSTAEPLVHISRARRTEVVLFGHQHPLRVPIMAMAGKNIVVRGDSSKSISVTQFASDGTERRETCAGDVASLITTCVEVGATYPEVVGLIQQLKTNGNLTSRVAFDAVPRMGRTYHRKKTTNAGSEADSLGLENIDEDAGDSLSLPEDEWDRLRS